MLKWERIIWPLIWRLPPKRRGRNTYARRLTMFLAGQYAAVLEWYFKNCAIFRERRAAVSPLPRDAKSPQDLCLQKLERGWARRIYRSLYSCGLADLSRPEILEDLRSRFPRRGARYLPAMDEFSPFQPVQVDMRVHLASLENGRATWRGGQGVARPA